ncbi:MAG: YfhL family 4Fe-4S dicluster ferredoxin [Helicobacteraceae bacterium]|jgi:ferredoxin|nr:YfhL family 4Fe-4S dicluster ferredoxin [Helicobacteraceae bacterium]
MSLFITEDCIACDACIDECPNGAIAQGDPIYVIDSDLCSECADYYDDPACVAVCPTDCVAVDPDSVHNLNF